MRWAEFDRVGVFRYSDEESSRSFALEGKVAARIAASRYRRLMTLQRAHRAARTSAAVGRELEVLVEGASDEHEYVLMGRHAGQAPEIDGRSTSPAARSAPGEMRRVRITQASDYDLVGELLDDESATRRRRSPWPRISAPSRRSGASPCACCKPTDASANRIDGPAIGSRRDR